MKAKTFEVMPFKGRLKKKFDVGRSPMPRPKEGESIWEEEPRDTGEALDRTLNAWFRENPGITVVEMTTVLRRGGDRCGVSSGVMVTILYNYNEQKKGGKKKEE